MKCSQHRTEEINVQIFESDLKHYFIIWDYINDPKGPSKVFCSMIFVIVVTWIIVIFVIFVMLYIIIYDYIIEFGVWSLRPGGLEFSMKMVDKKQNC